MKLKTICYRWRLQTWQELANPMQTVFSFMVSPPSCFLHQPATDFAILMGAAHKLIPVPIRLVNLSQGALERPGGDHFAADWQAPLISRRRPRPG